MRRARRRPPCEELGGKHSGQKKSKWKVPAVVFSGRLVVARLGEEGPERDQMRTDPDKGKSPLNQRGVCISWEAKGRFPAGN